MSGFNKKTASWALAAVAAATVGVLAYQVYQREHARTLAREARIAEVRADKAEFERRCKEVAGYKFYRRAENVEGILLPKIRHSGDWRDRMAPGAAFALEGYDSVYITSFLEYRYPSSGVNDESYFTNTQKMKDAIPGFQYVDVIDEQDEKRYRYTPRWEEPWQYDKSYLKGYIKFFLDRSPQPSSEPAPRYSVTFEDHVVPAERARGLASSTVRVLDTQTGEVMAEMLRYAWTPGRASSENPTPWLTAYKCPGPGHGSDSATRQFVDRVLVPPGATAPPKPKYTH